MSLTVNTEHCDCEKTKSGMSTISESEVHSGGSNGTAHTANDEADGAEDQKMSPPKPGVYAAHIHQRTLSVEPSYKRQRTKSFTERIQQGPTKTGKVRWFCRQKGHGFVIPEEGGDDLFFHITDVDGEFAPHDDDEVSYKLCPIPPKFEKFQASHILIRNLAPGVKHERWTEPPSPHQHPHEEPNIQERRQSLSQEDIEKLQHQ